MHYQISDRNGWPIAEGQLERNREEAAKIVARIERSQIVERLCTPAGPRTGSAAHLNKAPMGAGKSADFLHYRTRSLNAAMARRIPEPTKTAILIGCLWIVAILYGLVEALR